MAQLYHLWTAPVSRMHCMPLDFFDLKARLLDQGLCFTPETLTELTYPDLLRAGIGDAGAAACSLDLVRAEAERRFGPWLERCKTMEELERQAPALKASGMLEDFTSYLLRSRPLEDVAQWSSQSARVRIFFLTKCLRAHGDNPGLRLETLYELLKTTPPADDQEGNLLTVMRFGAEALLSAITARGAVDASVIASRLKGYQYITRKMYPEEVTTCQQGIVQGYTCSQSCFLPALPTWY